MPSAYSPREHLKNRITKYQITKPYPHKENILYQAKIGFQGLDFPQKLPALIVSIAVHPSLFESCLKAKTVTQLAEQTESSRRQAHVN